MEGLRQFLYSLWTAFMGVVFVVRVERNARLHLIISVLVLGFAVFLGVSNAELAAVFFACLLVFTTEVVNTGLEKTLDLIEPGHHEQVRIVKDIAAGAVLVASIGALAVGAAIFTPYIVELLWHR